LFTIVKNTIKKHLLKVNFKKGLDSGAGPETLQSLGKIFCQIFFEYILNSFKILAKFWTGAVVYFVESNIESGGSSPCRTCSGFYGSRRRSANHVVKGLSSDSYV